MLRYAVFGIFAAVVAAEIGIEGIICPNCEYMISLVYHNETDTPPNSWMPAFDFTLNNSATDKIEDASRGDPDQNPGLYLYNFNNYDGGLQDRRMYVAAAAAPVGFAPLIGGDYTRYLLNCTFMALNTGNGIVFQNWINQDGSNNYTANPSGSGGGPTHVNCAETGSPCPATGSKSWEQWSSVYPYGEKPDTGTDVEICVYKLQDASGAATVGVSTLGIAVAIVAASIFY